MTDKLIRELLIDVKQKGATRTAKSIENVSDALENAAAASELTNEQLGKMPRTLYSIERAADRAAKSLTKMQASRGMTGITKSIDGIGDKLDYLAIQLIEVTDKLEIGFDGVSRSVKAMGNDVAAATEKVQDRLYDTNRVLGGTARGFNDTAGAAGRASRAIGNTSGSARGATRDFAAMAKIGGSLPIMYAALASNIFVLQSAFEQLKLGDQLNRLEKFGVIVGTQTGTPVQTLARSLQEAAGYAISFEEAMRQASSASAYGFDAEQLNKFGLVARRAAAVLGVDMTDALNRVIKGVSKQEIELLDELGVTIRLNDAYADYVKQLNAANTGITYNVNSLTTFQKQQAYANAVIAESTKRFGYLDEVLRATPWEQFAANADAALRKIQQAAAKYLGPVIDAINTVFYTSQASISAEAARAQEKTNRQIDPTNVGAVALSLAASEEGYNKALDMYKESLDKRNKLKSEFDKRMEQADFYTKLAIRQVGEGIPVGLAAAGASEANKQFVAETAAMGLQVTRLGKEVEDSTENLNAWKSAYQAAGAAAAKASPEFQKQINLQRDTTDPDAVYDFNSTVLKGLTEQQKAYNQTKKTASDLANDIQNVAQNTDTAAKTSATLADAIKNIESLSLGTGKSADEYVKNLNLGYNTLSEMKTASQALSEYVKLTGNETKNQLAVQQKIADVYNQTKDKEKAQEAGRRLELQQLEEQEAALRRVLQTNQGNKAVEKEIEKIQLEKLKLTNQGMEAQKKVKDYTDKILGVDREIALLNNRTMTDTQYRLAQLNLELTIEKEKYEWYTKQADKQKEAEQSRRAQAQIEREIWKFRQDQIASMAAGREEEQQRQFTTKPLMGNAERLQEQLKLYEDLKQKTLGNAAAQAEYNKKIAETRAQLAGLRAQRNAEMQASVGSSLGAVYTPTTGLSGEDKDFADMGNRMASYDQAISKLSELNSEATAVAQSMGNLTNAMIQFSMKSLDTTSTIAAGMQAVSSVIQYSASQQVSAIDQAIAAEQKRDGKSEASKAKLKKLEAEKLKIQQDAAKKQIIIQTAVAVMQAATAVPYPFSIPLMVAAGLAGALALAQASSASGMSSIADSGADTTSYLTLGERQKNIDVSMSANAGELSYIRGDKGIGGANSFVPRAEGGNMYPGVSYQMGEHGTEVVTPMVPMKATPNDELKTSSNSTSGRPIILNISAMDAASFREFASSNSGALRDAVELALNENGASLKTLGNS
ncbi:tail length tape-measure protein [Bacteriophage T5-like saus47N]|uniref:Tail length tape-measure protein n=6 Tax=Tequintavirus chee24 TaxID=2733981 RepID=A0A2K8HEV3_9CAUD|nr:tail length tape measure protein [Escherichia phage chee24]ASU01740.1 tail length tape-measure protein [Bacteriophage T5-like pork27]ASU01892.1 tail length tape-measure protein [Bacteriophage T5-like pork29]ASU02043.1 tail length tape-measure protein [Bacteriophage T5-like saus47N]ASU02194.1 tail length tape-measure protein [Bacteriophage T5-like saus111K]ASU02345.1 tail length tape-measure protein [Bacteriophage T5-like poul124]